MFNTMNYPIQQQAFASAAGGNGSNIYDKGTLPSPNHHNSNTTSFQQHTTLNNHVSQSANNLVDSNHQQKLSIETREQEIRQYYALRNTHQDFNDQYLRSAAESVNPITSDIQQLKRFAHAIRQVTIPMQHSMYMILQRLNHIDEAILKLEGGNTSLNSNANSSSSALSDDAKCSTGLSTMNMSSGSNSLSSAVTTSMSTSSNNSSQDMPLTLSSVLQQPQLVSNTTQQPSQSSSIIQSTFNSQPPMNMNMHMNVQSVTNPATNVSNSTNPQSLPPPFSLPGPPSLMTIQATAAMAGNVNDNSSTSLSAANTYRHLYVPMGSSQPPLAHYQVPTQTFQPQPQLQSLPQQATLSQVSFNNHQATTLGSGTPIPLAASQSLPQHQQQQYQPLNNPTSTTDTSAANSSNTILQQPIIPCNNTTNASSVVATTTGNDIHVSSAMKVDSTPMLQPNTNNTSAFVSNNTQSRYSDDSTVTNQLSAYEYANEVFDRIYKGNNKNYELAVSASECFFSWYDEQLYECDKMSNNKEKRVWFGRVHRMITYMKAFVPDNTVIEPKPSSESSSDKVHLWRASMMKLADQLEQKVIQFCAENAPSARDGKKATSKRAKPSLEVTNLLKILADVSITKFPCPKNVVDLCISNFPNLSNIVSFHSTTTNGAI